MKKELRITSNAVIQSVSAAHDGANSRKILVVDNNR